MGKTKLKLEIDTELLEEARRHGVPLIDAVEAGLRAALEQQPHGDGPSAQAKQWAAENADAIRDHRQRIEEFGVFGEDLRTW